ncbi:MAG TPA: hypothetical protein PKD83_02625, partial [Ignavibacteria bacterium]|nr:hypothetical protein [Ignavibacteria bacterium]
KFGEFKSISFDKVFFKPSKKLQRKINYNFNNLEIAEIEFQENQFTDDQNEFEYKMSEEFKNNYKEICESAEENGESSFEETVLTVKKKLISDELIKLHNEITDCNNLNTNYKSINLNL